jgi:hypothetical protein
MRISWWSQKEKTEHTPPAIPKSPKPEYFDITARYFILDRGCPGDTKTLVKFDGSYWRWIPDNKTWFLDQSLTKEDYQAGHLQSIPKDEAEKFMIS